MKCKILIGSLILVSVISFSGCKSETKIQEGDIKEVENVDNANEDLLDRTHKERLILSFNNQDFDIGVLFNIDSLVNLKNDELSFLRNSIYAKHGYVFSKQEYKDYFLQYEWYSPSEQNVEHLLNDVDKKNIVTIISLEKKNSSIFFESVELGFSIEFPSSWDKKYNVVETDNGITVYFETQQKSETQYGEFFSIISKESMDLDDESEYDTIGNEKYFSTTENTYFIGGPTDFALPESHPEIKVFQQMNREVLDIIKSIKPLKK